MQVQDFWQKRLCEEPMVNSRLARLIAMGSSADHAEVKAPKDECEFFFIQKACSGALWCTVF